MTNYNRPPGNRDEELQYERERAAENNGTANGLAIGGGIAALVGLGAALYYWSRPNPVPAPTTIINPPAVSPAASSSPQPPQPTKTIERTVERTTPPKVIEVPKPIIVPGATRTVEVQKPVVVPASPSSSVTPSPAATQSPIPSATSAPTPTQSPLPIDPPATTPSSNGTNNSD
jgi:hypothetical protein